MSEMREVSPSELWSAYKRLHAATRELIAAMRTSMEVGATDHLDACEDGGEFWYGAIERAEKALSIRQ